VTNSLQENQEIFEKRIQVDFYFIGEPGSLEIE
jgi:hypothetical protein